MLKRLLKILEISQQSIVFAVLLRYFTIILILLLTVSCAPRHVVMPSYEDSIENVIDKLKDIKSIEAVLSVEYEKNDSVMSADALLNISEDQLKLRLYYLGFLLGELSEENGAIQSQPKIDKNKSTILVEGLKNGFFWWIIKDYELKEYDDIYELRNSYRKIFISKRTLLPLEQTIEFSDGEKLRIFYEAPERFDIIGFSATSDFNPLSTFWYNSRLKIEFKDNLVKIKIKSLAVTRRV